MALIVVAFHTHSTEAVNNDGIVLLSLVDKLAAHANYFSTWNSSDKYPCLWNGVTCNPDHTVTKLNLSQSQLSGKLSPAISGLHNLKELYLGSNNLSGSIPPELGNYTKMEVLDLS